MHNDLLTNAVELIPQVQGFAFPNERTLHPLWSVLIVV